MNLFYYSRLIVKPLALWFTVVACFVLQRPAALPEPTPAALDRNMVLDSIEWDPQLTLMIADNHQRFE